MQISGHVPDTAPRDSLRDHPLPYSSRRLPKQPTESDFSVEPSLPCTAKSACKGRAGSRRATSRAGQRS